MHPEGTALLVAGTVSLAEARRVGSPVHTLGQIGEALLATGAPWRIRRLSPGVGERYAPDRANLKRFIDELAQPADVAVLVLAAQMTTAFEGPAIVTGGRHREYPSDATLPLSWVRERLGSVRAGRLLVVLSAQDGDARETSAAEARQWLDALGTGRAADVIAVDASRNGESRALEALLAGLCGEALDPRTGTVTMRSIGEHLARIVPGIAMQSSLASHTLAVSPPLGGLWTVRASELSRVVAQPPGPDQPDDLTGVVLPGRFRIEQPLASGSFGRVYRARQLSVERDVAVKVLHAGIDPTSEDGRLFVHEIQSVGRIDHANVVRIYQADITPGGRLFFAMELLVGRDLQQIVNDEKSLAQERAVGLAGQLLAGLGAAHEAGLVHADVKPANAFVVSGRERERLVLLDFGLARLRRPGSAAESAGGTPAYMAPEQLHDGRVDARSDLFSAALVLVTMLTGWRRRSAEVIVPPLDGIADPGVRAALARALAIDPTERFPSAAAFAGALAGDAPGAAPSVVIRSPFRHLAPFTERDRGRLYGRERDLAELTDQVLYRRAVVYTAPSGCGKTSLLRAGLVPHLESLGARAIYLTCRAGASAALAAAIWPDSASVAEAVTAWHQEQGGKLVLILDQLEAVLSRDTAAEPTAAEVPAGAAEAPAGDLIGDVLAFDRWPADADVAVVLAVREDFLARVVGGGRQVDEGISILRLGPLGRDGALAAIVGPLAEQRLAIAPDLLEALLGDLEAAARAIAPEMGWGPVPAAYPPHLQLACSVLYEALGAGEATITLEHYRRLGGFDAIVGEHLDRVLDTELDPAAAAVARDLFLTLVSAGHTRAQRTEAELIDIAGSRHGADRVAAVLEALRARSLLVRLRATGGEPIWELVHDSLVPRVLAWVDRRDLDRRRAMELVRYHLRRSRPGSPSLLRRAELRELGPHADAIVELEAERGRRTDEPLSPTALVDRSRRALRRRYWMIACAILAVVSASGVAALRWWTERQLRDRDMGRFVLELAPFGWDPQARRAVPVPVGALPSLRWQIHEVDPEDEHSPNQPVAEYLVVRGDPAPAADGLSLVEQVEARGGSAFLVVDGRGRGRERCPRAIIPLRRLPGYAQRDRAEAHFRVKVPTCQATDADMVEIPPGPFIFGGPGQPVVDREDLSPESTVDLPAFSIDRTEVSNAAFQVFAEMDGVTGIAMPAYPGMAAFRRAGEQGSPVAGLPWSEARAYCRFLGKDLPSTEQWTKAARGGLTLADGRPNPMPRRNLPWGEPVSPVPAKLKDTGEQGPVEVGSYAGDRSPYGVLDLAGNVYEWTGSEAEDSKGYRITRGGSWTLTTSSSAPLYMALDNFRPEGTRHPDLGMRCALPSSGRM